MGLSIHPGGAAWSYSGFASFRRRLAADEGIELQRMVGFGAGEQPWTTSNGYEITVLAPLLNHSDCDGYLDRYECEQMLPRLRSICGNWTARAREKYDPELEYDLAQFRALIDGMEHSATFGCSVVFG
jgi:hypothetical protein